ncbi:hypothetical protein GCM10009612_04440 [Streptomyces beijiangensis]
MARPYAMGVSMIFSSDRFSSSARNDVDASRALIDWLALLEFLSWLHRRAASASGQSGSN